MKYNFHVVGDKKHIEFKTGESTEFTSFNGLSVRVSNKGMNGDRIALDVKLTVDEVQLINWILAHVHSQVKGWKYHDLKQLSDHWDEKLHEKSKEELQGMLSVRMDGNLPQFEVSYGSGVRQFLERQRVFYNDIEKEAKLLTDDLETCHKAWCDIIRKQKDLARELLERMDTK